MNDGDNYHISSLVIRTLPDNFIDICTAIEALPEAEIHQTDDNAKIVAVLETPNEHGIIIALDAIQKLPGVLNASLIYHHVEEQSAETQESL